MYRQALLFLRIFLITIVATLVASCNSDRGSDVNDKKFNVASTRPVADALDKRTADSRKARIADVKYQLHLEVFEHTDWFSGESTLSFELNDATTALTIDFTGGNVSEVRVNGQPVRVDYNGFFVAPKTSLHLSKSPPPHRRTSASRKCIGRYGRMPV